MADIRLGKQYDDSKSRLSVVTDGGGGLRVTAGDLHDRSSQSVTVKHAESESKHPPRAANETDEGAAPKRNIAVAVTLVAAFAVLLTTLGAVAQYVRPVFVPLVIVAAMVALYVVALAVLPSDSSRGLTNFGAILREFMGLAFGRGTRRPPNDTTGAA